MSKKFYAEHRETGKRWKPTGGDYNKEFLMMYDSGYLAVVSTDGWTTSITPLDTRTWRKVVKESILT